MQRKICKWEAGVGFLWRHSSSVVTLAPAPPLPRFRWFRTTDGQDLLEYAIIGAFVAIVVLAGATGLGSSINRWFDAVAGTSEEEGENPPDDGAAGGGGKKSNCGARGMAASHGKCHGG